MRKRIQNNKLFFLVFCCCWWLSSCLYSYSSSSSSTSSEGSFSLWLLVRSQWLHRMPIIFAVSQADSRIIRSECTFIVLSIVFFGFGICIGFQMFFACLKLHSKKFANFEMDVGFDYYMPSFTFSLCR